MRRNCNLTLTLESSCYKDHHHHHHEESPADEVDSLSEGRSQNENTKENENHQITIFYDGKVNVCDVTELQAMAIIKLASEEIEEKQISRSPSSEPSTPSIISPSQGGLSMKMSLQMFLQKRKHRIQATSPYHR